MWKKVHILGLNAHGLSALTLARKHNIIATASDLKTKFQLTDVLEKFPDEDNSKGLFFGYHPDEVIKKAEVVVLSPGVVSTTEMIKKINQNTNWISVADFAYAVNKWNPDQIIAVTGSYGKTSLINLISKFLTFNDFCPISVGNYNNPFAKIGKLNSSEFLLAEIDYQQLIMTKIFNPKIFIVTNIVPEQHVLPEDIDYVKSKLQLINKLGKESFCLIDARSFLKYSNVINSKSNLIIVDSETSKIPPEINQLYLSKISEIMNLNESIDSFNKMEQNYSDGRFNKFKINGIEFIDDSHSKGKFPVNYLIKYFEKSKNSVLITFNKEIKSNKVNIIYLNTTDNCNLSMIVEKIRSYLNNGSKLFGFSPGMELNKILSSQIAETLKIEFQNVKII